MNLPCQYLDPFGQGLVLPGQRSVGLDKELQIGGLLLDRCFAVLKVPHYFFTVRLEMVERVLISVGLAGLREQDQRRCVSSLRGEGEVQQTAAVIVWIAVNAVAVGLRWDPYPFILGRT